MINSVPAVAASQASSRAGKSASMAQGHVHAAIAMRAELESELEATGKYER